MPAFEHFVLTRFNVRQTARHLGVATDHKWLCNRFELFEQFCFPSVSAQSDQSFRWLVFFDAATPQPFRDRARAFARWPNMEIIHTDEMSHATVRTAIGERLADDTRFVMTTRLDNDDALHEDFIRVLQEHFCHQEREVLNFTEGYIWQNGRAYLYRDRSNAFATMVERRDDFLTVWCRQHPDLAEVAPVRQLTGLRAWLQVVHGQNVSNRVRGIRRPISCLHQGFRINPALIPEKDPPIEYGLDRWVCGPFRALREIGIRFAKCSHRSLTTLHRAHAGRKRMG